MTATPELGVRPEPATGQSFECWLNETLSYVGTGNTSRFTVTYLHSPLAEPNNLPSLIARRHNVTDPEAGLRFKERELLSWSKNLNSLNTVAAMIFPGIRELNEVEQRSLRNIYRKLSRKA